MDTAWTGVSSRAAAAAKVSCWPADSNVISGSVAGWLVEQEVRRGAGVVRCAQQGFPGADPVPGSPGLFARGVEPLRGALPRPVPACLIPAGDRAGGDQDLAQISPAVQRKPRGAQRFE